MKNLIKILLLSFAITPMVSQSDIDSTGFAGDNFSLQGALELFKESQSLEEFENKLNAQESYVNNLDLNEDGEIDYIRVVDNMDKDVHAIVLQAPLSETETQDIAVIAVEKTGKEEAMLQIIGDADVYGEETIVEPSDDEEYSPSKGKGGLPAAYESAGVFFNVWTWGCVRHVYRPSYRVWVSPWKWRYYPRIWKPWRPLSWRIHYHKRPVHKHFRYHPTVRVVHAHKIYVPKRKTTVRVQTKTVKVRTVHKNNNTKVVRGKRTTTTKVVKKNKDGTVVKKEKTTTTKKGVKKNSDGTTTKKGKKTTTKKGKKKNSDGTTTKKGKKTTKKKVKKKNN